MKYLLYKLTNTINGKFYIGVHQTLDENDSYFGSGYRLRAAIRKYGKHNFIKEILEYFDSADEMFEVESKIVTRDFLNRTDVYNVALGGRSGGFHGRRHTDETKEKISKSNMGRIVTDETKELIRNKLKGKKPSIDSRLKMSVAAKNVQRKPHSAETKEKIRLARANQKMKPHSAETKEKISSAMKRK